MFESIKQLDKILLLITCLIAGDRTFENFFNTCIEFPAHPRLPVFFKPWMMDFAVFVPTALKPNDGTSASPSIISLLDPVLIKSRIFYSFSESIRCLHLLMQLRCQPWSIALTCLVLLDRCNYIQSPCDLVFQDLQSMCGVHFCKYTTPPLLCNSRSLIHLLIDFSEVEPCL